MSEIPKKSPENKPLNRNLHWFFAISVVAIALYFSQDKHSTQAVQRYTEETPIFQKDVAETVVATATSTPIPRPTRTPTPDYCLLQPTVEPGQVTASGTTIICGQQAGRDEYPYMSRVQSCGASLVAPEWVLTAAHCVDDVNTARVRVGLSTISEHQYIYSVPKEEIHISPGFNADTLDEDFALLKIPAVTDITPVKLIPQEIARALLPGTDATVVGFGSMVPPEDESYPVYPNVLQEGLIQLVEHDACVSQYEEVGLRVTQNMLCAVGRTASNRIVDSCSGDSGGPVIWLDPETGKHFQWGIVSFGLGCAEGLPGVYTDVTNFFDWAGRVTDGQVGHSIQYILPIRKNR